MRFAFLKNAVFFRHSEIEWNAKKMIHVWLDHPLQKKECKKQKTLLWTKIAGPILYLAAFALMDEKTWQAIKK